MIQEWYAIEKHKKIYVVWYNKETYTKDSHGSLGSYGVFSAKTKKECQEYCKEHNIKLKIWLYYEICYTNYVRV